MKKIYYLSTVFLTLLLIGASVSTTAQTQQLVQPNSTGIAWVIETTHNIVWGGAPGTDYNIYYRKGGGTAVLIDDVESGNTYSWYVPNITLGTDFKIELHTVGANPETATPVYASLNAFEITNTYPSGDGEIHVEQPNVTGIQWEPGKQYGIYWTDDLVEPVKIELWEDVGGGGEQIYSGAGVTDLPTSVEGTGYIWTIPAGITVGNYWIKVQSTTTLVHDFGENYFTITDDLFGGTYISMIQPDSTGIQWLKGTTHLISWMDDLIETVDLVLYVEDAGVYVEYEAGLGAPLYNGPSDMPTDNVGTTADWPIPATLPNGNYQVYAESSVVSTINDHGVRFEVTDTPSGGSTITLIQPEVAGIQWLNEGTYVISWMDDLIEDVKLELWYLNTTPNPDVWEEYTDYTNLPATGVVGTTVDWTIPPAGANTATQLPTGDYRIRVESTVTPSIFDISTNTFEITTTPHGGETIEVIQPDIAGIEWEQDTEHLISWMDDLIENVKIQLWIDGGAEIPTATAGLTLAQDLPGTTWSWEIPAALPVDDYVIKVISTVSTVNDVSEFPFKVIDYSPYGEVIMIQPNGGEEWIKGNSYLISWTDNISENVDIYVTDDYNDAGVGGGHPWDLITPAGGVPSSTWAWNTDVGTGGTWPAGLAATGDKFKMKIQSVNYSSGSTAIDISEDPFDFVQTLGGEVWVIQPNGGEVWVDETEHLISWMDELVENVYIKLYDYTAPGTPILIYWDDAGLPDYTDGVGIVGTTHTWDIPEVVTSGDGLYINTPYKIVIESIYGSQYNDITEGTFTIVAEQTGGTTIDVVQPDGGEEWALNTEHLISWDDDVFENVDIDLVDANETLIRSIATDVVGTTHVWDIDDALYGVGTYKVLVKSSVTPGTLYDYSAAVFTITGVKGAANNFNFGNNVGELVIYPNPTSTEFTVAAPGSIDRVEVRNLLGQVLYTNNVNAGQTVIDVSNYDSGIYIVNIIAEGDVVTKKLFVQ